MESEEDLKDVKTQDSDNAVRKQQPEADLIDEINRLLDFDHLNDLAPPGQSPSRNLETLAIKSPSGKTSRPDIKIGDWYYPTGASRWSIFRGLATGRQVSAMLAATQSLQLVVLSTKGPTNFLRTAQFNPDSSLQANQLVTISAFAAQPGISELRTNSNPFNPGPGSFPQATNSFSSVPASPIQIGGTIDNNMAIPRSATFFSIPGTVGIASQPDLFVMRAAPIGPSNPGDQIGPFTVSSLMYMLPPRPLADHGGGFDGLYLVTLVDERYWFQYSSVTLHLNSSTSWDNLIVACANALGIFIYYTPIESTYSQPEPDSPLWVNEENPAVLLDAIAANLGRVVVRALDGTYTLKSNRF